VLDRPTHALFDPARYLFGPGPLLPTPAVAGARASCFPCLLCMLPGYECYPVGPDAGAGAPDGLDALVAPTLPGPTVPVDKLALDLTDGSGESPGSSYFRTCVAANVVGVPVLSVPGGFTSDGLPIGIALWGRPLQEGLLFRIARAYEHEHAWHERVPSFEVPRPPA